MKLLYVSSSPNAGRSQSTRVADHLVARWQADNPAGTVTHLDLARNPLPHIDAEFVAATRGKDGPTSDAQRAVLARSDKLVDELLDADLVVIATGMMNFTIPSTLKSWIDHVARPGRTFSYGAGGPKGLATGKKVIVVAASGGIYSGESPYKAADFQVPYLKTVLGFIGLTDVEVIEVEGLGLGPEAAEQAVTAAFGRIEKGCEAAKAA